MAWSFRKRIKIFPGLHLNVSKSGLGFNIGPKGANFTLGPTRASMNMGIPGTGLYNRQYISYNDSSVPSSSASAESGCVSGCLCGCLSAIVLYICYMGSIFGPLVCLICHDSPYLLQVVIAHLICVALCSAHIVIYNRTSYIDDGGYGIQILISLLMFAFLGGAYYWGYWDKISPFLLYVISLVAVILMSRGLAISYISDFFSFDRLSTIKLGYNSGDHQKQSEYNSLLEVAGSMSNFCKKIMDDRTFRTNLLKHKIKIDGLEISNAEVQLRYFVYLDLMRCYHSLYKEIDFDSKEFDVLFKLFMALELSPSNMPEVNCYEQEKSNLINSHYLLIQGLYKVFKDKEKSTDFYILSIFAKDQKLLCQEYIDQLLSCVSLLVKADKKETNDERLYQALMLECRKKFNLTEEERREHVKQNLAKYNLSRNFWEIAKFASDSRNISAEIICQKTHCEYVDALKYFEELIRMDVVYPDGKVYRGVPRYYLDDIYNRCKQGTFVCGQ